jgi:hypothetical protein
VQQYVGAGRQAHNHSRMRDNRGKRRQVQHDEACGVSARRGRCERLDGGYRSDVRTIATP